METTHFHLAYDGGCKYMQQFSEELARRGHEVEIVTTLLRDKTKNKGSRYLNGVLHTFLPPKYTGRKLIPFNMFYKFRFIHTLNKYLKHRNFDILHSCESFAHSYLHKKERNPVIMQSWALEPFYGDECKSQKGLKALYVKLFLQKPWLYCLKNSECITADKPFQVPLITSLGLDKKKISFIPNGIAWKEIQKKKKHFKNRRKELGFNKKDLVILSVCQMVIDKGVLEIVDAFNLAKKTIPTLKMVMIGKGILEETLKTKIKDLKLEKDIKMLKDIDEEILFDYHFSSDIFVNAVRTNNFMLSIQEGMACGLPIISSAQPFLIKDGVNGYIVGINSPQGLAEGIIKLYNSGNYTKIKKMGKASTKLSEEYDWSHIVDSAEAVYNKLIKKSGGEESESRRF